MIAASGPLVAVLDYGIGNLRSAQKALQHVGADARLTADPALVAAADAVVLPGVGAFGACMQALRGAGLEPVVYDAVASGRPFMGICVGMQMLFSSSQEDPDDPGLGIIPGTIEWITSRWPRPQMQWNQLHLHPAESTPVDPMPVDPTPVDPMFEGLGKHPWVYFVHSLHGVPLDPTVVAATCQYDGTVNAAFRSGNVFATQFHPEKSGPAGLALLRNFVGLVQAVAGAPARAPS